MLGTGTETANVPLDVVVTVLEKFGPVTESAMVPGKNDPERFMVSPGVYDAWFG